MRYAEVAVELPVAGTFQYQVPERWAHRQLFGARVLIPFGNRGVTGVVVGDGAAPELDADRVRAIEDVLDETPSLNRELVELCRWVADYYQAPPGEVLRAALPVGSRVSFAQRVVLTEAGRAALSGEASAALSRADRQLLGSLAAAGGALARTRLRRDRGADLATLQDRGLVEITAERSRPRVRARLVRVATLVRPLSEDDLAKVAQAPRRRDTLDALVAAGGTADVAALAERVPRASAHLRELSRLGLVEIKAREVRRDGWTAASAQAVAAAPQEPPPLTEPQAAALAAVRGSLAESRFAPFLLHGITGSGKTEVYLHAIAEVLQRGRTAIVLVPEISLTPQLSARFRARFGDQVAVLHSGLSDGERFDEWHRLRSGAAQIALGARSAVFAPVANLGIVVVDEEHDPSFKQEEGVRYHARDVALVRAQRSGALCVLGSATPSLESFYGARSGRYRLLSLPGRATARPLPEVDLVDLRVYRPEGDAMLTAPLASAIESTLSNGDQVILFLNRRGFSTFVICRRCGHAFRCSHCSVSLTYHRAIERLLCHYCGYAEPVPTACPECGGKQTIERKGIGTEKVAAAVQERFPGARIARLDRDSAAGAGLQNVLAAVARREVDILVGTQMVTKGHDFPGVTLVGVLCADTGLSLPDFRAGERTFQLLTQVAGRAGRGDRPGKVMIQTFQPQALPVAAARTHDYHRFFQAEASARAELDYPPSGHLIAIRLDGCDADSVVRAARKLGQHAEALKAARQAAVTILGPVEAPLGRIKGRTRWHLWLRGSDRKTVRRFVRELIALIDGVVCPASVRVTVDVDPVSAL
jgi:primosomal protein N' (replication factor Y) (superfamily II helicase)